LEGKTTMRIAYTTQAYPPIVSGVSVCVDHLAHAMAARGHEVLVIAPSDQGRPYAADDKDLLLRRFRSLRNPWRARQRFMLFPWREVRQALREFRPQIIHSHDPLQLGLLALHYARTTHIPIITTTHQLPRFLSLNLPDLGGLQAAVETVLWEYAGWLLARHHVVVSPTQTIASVLAQKTGLYPEVISNGVKLDVFHPSVSLAKTSTVRQRLGIPANVPIILHVGQLHPGKRVDCIIQACAPILQQSDARLVIVGDGPQKASLMKTCRELGITGKVSFTGFITVQEGLPEIYRLASLFTTACEIETQGIVLLEAAASGLPIAAVNATCIPEIVQNGVNGYLVEPGDINGLSRAMLKILSVPSLAQSMGLRSRAFATEHDTRFTVDAYERLYQDAVSGRPDLAANRRETARG
jgi:glycosyltransferase involved in cell wall biosynthesis